MRLSSLLAAVLALAMPHPAGAQPWTHGVAPPAVLSSMTVSAGSSVTLTLLPSGISWPAGVVVTPVATGLQGTFSPVSALPVGSAPLVFTFTASAAGSGTLGATYGFPLVAVAAAPNTVTLGGASFHTFGLQTGTTVSQATAGSSPIVINAPAQSTDTFQGIKTPVADGPGTWTARMQGGGPSGFGYATGMLVGQTAQFESFIYPSQSFTVLLANGNNVGGAAYPWNGNGATYCLRLVRDDTNWYAYGAPGDGAAGSFIKVAQVPLSTIGTVTELGVFANPNGQGNSSGAGGVSFTGWQYVAGQSDPQAAASFP